jgi:hypothetical protein
VGGVLGHFVLMVVIVDKCRVVGGGAGLREDEALLDGVRDHVGQLHRVLGGEGCCVVLEGHYLASFMSYNVCLRRLRSVNLFWILSLGRDRLHDIQGVIPRLLIIVNSHNHVFLSGSLFKQVKE